jgi:hypothetical protein
MNFTTYLLTTFCIITFINAVLWDGAQSTSLGLSPSWNPNPTPAPPLGGDTALQHSNDLHRRQIAGGLCGYVSGQLSTPPPPSIAAVIDISMQTVQFHVEIHHSQFALRCRVYLP